MQKKFIAYSLLFLLPIVLLMAVLEVAIDKMPGSYKNIASYSEEAKDSIALFVTGSSQMQGAINPEFIDIPAITYASGSQHHSEDFNLFMQLKDLYPSLQYVAFELTYGHFDIPHNNDKFWKNAVYLKYYGVNGYDRKTYFKDELLYISNPDAFSRTLHGYYISKKRELFQYNRYGYNTSDAGIFKNLDFDTTRIHKRKFGIRNDEYPEVFKINAPFFNTMVDEARKAELKVIIIKTPTYKTYARLRNLNMVRRRDSVLHEVLKKHNDVWIFDLEADSINFQVTDYRNENHLNPKGGEKMTKLFNTFLRDSVMVD